MVEKKKTFLPWSMVVKTPLAQNVEKTYGQNKKTKNP
jgi:hypothetical protein